MNKDRMRVKIAEACGWKFDLSGMPTDKFGVTWPVLGLRAVPNYHLDLNACHEMEKVLKNHFDDRLWEAYIFRLDEMLGSGDKIHATADQRCECFCRTLGLWEEEVGG